MVYLRVDGLMARLMVSELVGRWIGVVGRFLGRLSAQLLSEWMFSRWVCSCEAG